jgi:hypothetical protein
MNADPFEHDDAAYVLGALDPQERIAFEIHLDTCDACMARVAEIRAVPSMLAGISMQDIVDSGAELPQTLLPGLIRRAAKERRSSRRLFAGMAAVAAAAVAALVIVAWPTGTDSDHGTRQALTQLVNSPVTATVELTSKTSGTYLEVRCHYAATYAGAPASTAVYWLVVEDKHGNHQKLSSWTLKPGPDQTFEATTALRKSDISKVEITYQGNPILSLNT